MLTDQGSIAGHLNASALAIRGKSTNVFDFRNNNSNLTLTGDFLQGENISAGFYGSGIAYLGSGIVKIGGGLHIRPDDSAGTGGLFEMISGGTLEFTGTSATLESMVSGGSSPPILLLLN